MFHTTVVFSMTYCEALIPDTSNGAERSIKIVQNELYTSTLASRLELFTTRGSGRSSFNSTLGLDNIQGRRERAAPTYTVSVKVE